MSKKNKSAAGVRTVKPLVGKRCKIVMDVSGLPAIQVWFWYRVRNVWRGLVQVQAVTAPTGSKPKSRKTVWFSLSRVIEIEPYHASHEVM